MTTIENKYTTLLFETGKPEVMNYADIMLLIMNKLSEKGFTVAEMKKDFRVIDVLDAAVKEKKQEISFEDADFQHFLTKYPENFGWGLEHRDLIEFDDYIRAVKPQA